MRKLITNKHLLSLLGWLFLCLIFYSIWEILSGIDIGAIFLFDRKLVLQAFLLNFAGCFISMLLLCLAWRYCVFLITGKEYNLLMLSRVYLVSNIGKYLPGNIFNFVSRSYLLLSENIGKKQVVASSIVEVLLSVASNFSMVALTCGLLMIFAPSHLKGLLPDVLDNRSWSLVLPIALIAVIAGAVLYAKWKHKIVDYLRIIIPHRDLLRPAKNILTLNSIVFIVEGVSYYLVILILSGNEVSFVDGLLAISVFGFATFVGFLTPGLPAGIGVKEGLTILWLSGSFPAQIILLALVVCRISAIFAEVVLFFAVRLTLGRN